MGTFAGLQDAKRGFQSNYLQAGKYVLRIDTCEYFQSDAGAEFWKNTMTVLAVDHGPHRVGEIVNTMWKKGDTKAKHDIFNQNLKTFLCGVSGRPDDQVGPTEANMVSGEEGIFKGLVVVCTATQRTSKTTVKKNPATGDMEPSEYTVYSWSTPLDDKQILEAIGAESYAKFFPNG